MSSLRDIRSRIRSVENIKKITDTMERIAAARLRHAQAMAEQARPYIYKMKELLENLAAAGLSHPLFEPRKVQRTGVVIIAADRGLSGSYNANIFAAADRFLKKYDKDRIRLILLGRKAIDHYAKRQWKVRYQFSHWVESRSFDKIKQFADQLVAWFLSGELDEIWLIYTHYISIMRREVMVEKFLNIERPTSESNGTTTTKVPINYIFEQRPEEILANIVPKYCASRIQTALYEAYASELAARIVAMQTASKNSEEMIEKLTLIKNKTRQRDITREMIEITTGAEALH